VQGCTVGGTVAAMVYLATPADAEATRVSTDLATLGVTVDCPSEQYSIVSGSLEGTVVDLPTGNATLFTFANVGIRDLDGNSYTGEGGVVMNVAPGQGGISLTSVQIISPAEGRVATANLGITFGADNRPTVDPVGECQSNLY